MRKSYRLFSARTLCFLVFLLSYKKEEILYIKCCKTLAQVAQIHGRCPIHGNIPGQDGQGSEQPDVAEDVPVHRRGVGLDGL